MSAPQFLERFQDQIESGGVVILDDYYDWPGCKTALDDFCKARGVSIKLRGGGEEPAHFTKPN